MNRLTTAVAAVWLSIGALGVLGIENKGRVSAFHGEAERAFLKAHLDAFFPNKYGSFHALNGNPVDSSILFPVAKTCGGCHGYDSTGLAMHTNSDVDINFYDAWRSSIMANSAKDPFWRAKVTHESLVNPAHSEALQDKCTSCHAPAGHVQSKHTGKKAHYTLTDLYQDPQGLDGVTCQTCHAMAPGDLGSLHSGQLNYDFNYIRVAYGPFENIFAAPMHQFVGITPKYGDHILDAGLCAGCHTLLTQSVDLSGQYTGATFVEQATYHEWLNSRYETSRDNLSCQSCHLPQIPDGVVLSSGYQLLVPRSPIGLHQMAGANATMLRLMRSNIQPLGINALPEHFDSTLSATLRMLREKTLDLSLDPRQTTGDTAKVAIRLLNKAGHKFPSGYPARRAWVEIVVRNEAGQTVLHSGDMNADYTLKDEDPHFEPHHRVIDRPDKVQIYELVTGDVNGQFTTVLERAHVALKDNRLPPQGFSKSHPAYDTTRIAGGALYDPDFNVSESGAEGSGADILWLHVPIDGYKGKLAIKVRVWYQSMPPKWLAPMFAFNSPEILSFKSMWDEADQSPTLVAEAEAEVSVSPVSAPVPSPASLALSLAPNPSSDGSVTLSVAGGARLLAAEIWDARGVLVYRREWSAVSEARLDQPLRSGVYYLRAQTSLGAVTRKFVVH
ncbi:MAG: T9SS type A sorting domain-containing protein [Saprospiraceae bacterium]